MTEKCICALDKGEERLLSKGSWLDLYIKRDSYDEYWIEGVSDGRASMKIDYCPKCGRKLEEEKQEEDEWWNE